MNIEAVAKRLVVLCREGKFEEAQHELYAADAVSIEMEGLPPGPLGNAKGLPAIIEKGHHFEAGLEQIHSISVSEPVIGGNWFSIAMSMDLSVKGRGRMDMREICVYQVRDGKIVHEQFFYDMG